MKKFTFMLLSAFIAVAAFAAAPQKRVTQLQKANALTISSKQLTPKAKAVRNLQAPAANKMLGKAQTNMRKAPKKAGVEDLLAMNWMLCSENYEYDSEAGGLVAATPAAGGHVVSFSMVDAETIAIGGFTSDATEAIQATFAMADEKQMEEGIIAVATIADGQTLRESDYGPVLLRNCSAEEVGTPINAYVYKEGYIVFDALWADILGGDGEYAGYAWSGYYYSSNALPVNGTMTVTTTEGETSQVPVVIEQDPENAKYVSVYNFAGEETAVTVTMKEDKSFVINEQPIFYYNSEYGYFCVSGLLISGGNYYLDTLTGVGTENTLTFNGNWMLYSPTKGSIYSLYEPATITLLQGEFAYPVIEDVAAVPADPEILSVGNYDSSNGYGYVAFTVPTTDVDGNDLKETNLFYQLYSDIAGDIQPIVFTPEICEKLTEDMTIIPYTFTDNWDFADKGSYKVVYLNYNFNSMYDRIGVKSIYTGGGETNESEIAWVEIEKTEPVNADVTFDFNAMDVLTSSGTSTEGDITETLELTEGNVTLAISPKDESATTANRFWNTINGPQLRVYSGTLTFTVPEGYVITEIVFNNGRWNDGNAADSGEFDGSTWTGEAQTVVVTIAGNSQINNIVVSVKELEPELVVLPAGLETELWTIEGTFADSYSSEEIQRPTEVAFDGTDVYVKGIPFWYEDAWMKGKLDAEAGIVTFPTGQFVGEDDYGKEYVVGTNDGETICDIEFAYDAEAKTLTQVTSYIVEGDEPNEIGSWGYWFDMVIYAGEPVVIDPVVAPEGLATETYLFKANQYIEEETEDDVISYWEEYTFQTEVGFDGNDVYFKGFSENTADMWAKGTLSEDGKTVTIPANQYMGELAILWYTFKYYLTAVDEEGNMVDLVLNYDAETNTFSTDQTMILNEGKRSVNPYQTFAGVVITKMEDFAAIPANPIIVEYVPEANYPRIDFNIPAKDVNGNDLLGSKLFYTLWVEKDGQEQPLTLTAGLYTKLTEDMTEIPYNFNDDYDIYTYGARVYLNQDAEEIASWTKIGVQSTYYGGGECNKSNLVWLETGTGIASLQETEKAAVIYNLAGQRVQKAQNGLFIVNGKKVMVK